MKDSYGREWSLGFEEFDRGTMYVADDIDIFTRNVKSTNNACTLDSLDSNDHACISLKDGTITFSDGTSLLTNSSNGSITCEKPVISFNPVKKLHFRVRDIKLSLDGLMRV